MKKIEFDHTDGSFVLAKEQSGDVDSLEDFNDQVWADWKLLERCIPIPNAEEEFTILDVGCGLAGIDVYLWRHYGPKTKLILLDGNQVEGIRGGYRSRSRFASMRSSTLDFLDRHGVDMERVEYHVMGGEFPDGIHHVDLVVSLRSWGYHYPLERYLWHVKPTMREHGTIILDAHYATWGLALFRQNFYGSMRLWTDSDNKFDRVVGFKGYGH